MQIQTLGYQLLGGMPEGPSIQIQFPAFFKQLLPSASINPPSLATGSVKHMHFKKHDPIFFAGDDFKYLYFVITGYVKADLILKNGHYLTHLFMIPGDWFGFKGLGRGQYESNVVALSDCKLLAVDGNALIAQMQTNLQMRNDFLAINSQAFSRADHHCLVLSSYLREQKLAYFLIDFQKRHQEIGQDQLQICLPMSREDLKSYLGMTSESLSRAFSVLEMLRAFKVRNRLITEINFGLLQKVVDQE